jgi:hypothetical protein
VSDLGDLVQVPLLLPSEDRDALRRFSGLETADTGRRVSVQAILRRAVASELERLRQQYPATSVTPPPRGE